jgi:predicted SnoaL-like aldol condensation-catalyzing enzyme
MTNLKTLVCAAAAFALLAAGPALAQSAAQLEANKKIAMEFFRPGITAMERYNLLHDGYIQHNPAFKKFADDNKISYKEGFLKMRSANMARQGGGGARGAGPTPPPNNATYLVMAEGDLVTVLQERNIQDPTAAPGTWYKQYWFDTFRIRDGKLYEHWDGAVINPPAPAGRGTGQ